MHLVTVVDNTSSMRREKREVCVVPNEECGFLWQELVSEAK